MDPRQRRAISWAVFVLLLLIFLAVVWMVFHIEPTATPDYQDSLRRPAPSRLTLHRAAKTTSPVGDPGAAA